MTARRSLAEGLAQQLLNDILEGRYLTNVPLPSETDLAESTGVSRLTVREAIKELASKDVVRVEQGRGTFVNPPTSWSVLDPVLLIARSAHHTDRLALPRQLIEARRVVEVAVAELAAERRTHADLEEMQRQLDLMRTTASTSDVRGFVAADIAFHQRVLDAAGNNFITALFDPLSRIMQLTRHQTSAHAPVRAHAIEHHQLILHAVRRGSSTKAGRAMRNHMDQTEKDMDTYVLDPGASILAIRAGDDDLPQRRRAGSSGARTS
ncbi:FadR/GntR family transcriptional regulator [Lapillicoccus sp.]|uniref:FadR/GntR family transcriptional regulator n=1 Tax=Lapillicoccus sp. TaxID=1909287 RepID=UPI0025DDC327|nr:FadR/GntR family transcriptional regulator [Lapillicoccus sp.]